MSISSSKKIKNELLNSKAIHLIDIKDNKECWFQHGYAVFYKTPLQILNSQIIIEKISPDDSCILGAICGEMYDYYLKNKILVKYKLKQSEIKKIENRFQLVSINRKGTVEYMDHNHEKKYSNSIIELAQEKKVICNFSSTDSFYIGFLAGMELFKIKNKLKIKPKKQVKLELVYSQSHPKI